jgi:hypothetical protein
MAWQIEASETYCIVERLPQVMVKQTYDFSVKFSAQEHFSLPIFYQHPV